LFKITVRNGVPHSAAIVSADVGTPKRNDPSPVTAITRERSLLLVLPRDHFTKLFNGEDAVARVFLDVIQRELVSTLRLSLRQHARLAASV